MFTMKYYLAFKKDEIIPLQATGMDLEIIILSEVNLKKTNVIWYCLYEECLKKLYKWTYLYQNI